MKRLTEWIDNGEDRQAVPKIDLRNNGHQRCCNKLAELEDLQEQGLLLKLPCKVGDTVWELCKCDDEVYRIFPMALKVVVSYGSIRCVKGKEPIVWNLYAESDYTYMYKSFYDLGKTVFLTKEEAEAKLKEYQGVMKE